MPVRANLTRNPATPDARGVGAPATRTGSSLPPPTGAAAAACGLPPSDGGGGSSSSATRRPRFGHRIAYGLSVLVELADDASLLDSDRLSRLTPKDRAALACAVAYARRLARWHRDRSFRLVSPKPRSPR